MILSVLKDVDPSMGEFTGKADVIRNVSDAIEMFNKETESIIRSALEKDDVVLHGPCEHTGVNVYNARSCKGFITSTYFLMYREGKEDKILQGNFVIKMQDDKTISSVYRWE